MKPSVILIFYLAFFSCSRDEYFGPIYLDDQSDSLIGTKRIIVGCEGNFQYDNASISIIDLDSESISNDVFINANKKNIGDVLQSMLITGDTLLCVLNNSGIIRLVDKKSFQEIEVMEGFTSPRYMLPVGKSQFAVSDLFANEIKVINIKTLKVTGSIDVVGWTEQMISMNESEFIVANLEKNSLMICDPIRLNVKKEIPTNCKPEELLVINQTEYLVIGTDLNNENKALIGYYTIEHGLSEALEVENRVAGASVIGDSLYLLHESKVSIYSVSERKIISTFQHQAQTPYGFIATNRGIFIADASDFLSDGKVLWYDKGGVLIKKFETGALPQIFTMDF